jgi:hypothetical protein
MKKVKEYPIPDGRAFEADLDEVQRVLKEAVERQKMGLDGLTVVRYQLLKVFGRIARMQEQIDTAFAGRAFWPDLSPMCPANIRRFDAFVGRQRETNKMMGRAIELWTLTCGIRWECDSKTCAAHNCPARGKRPKRRASIAKA